jgi:hypothetical protein
VWLQELAEAIRIFRDLVKKYIYQAEILFVLEPAGDNLVQFIDKEVFTCLLIPLLVNENDWGGFEAMDKALKARPEHAG